MSQQKTSLGGRLPLLNPIELDSEQKEFHKTLVDKMVSWAEESGFQADTSQE